MPEKTHPETIDHKHAAPPAKKLTRFQAPDSLAANFNVQAESEDHIEGVVSTSDVRGLLDSFGLHDRTSIVFPFQHIKKQHGEIWRMLIDQLAAHVVKGETVMGHRWIYERTYPESVGAPA